MESQTKTLSVPEMHCGKCVAAISQALGGLELQDRRVDLDTRTVVVTYAPAQTSLGTIVAAIEDQGYDVAPIED